MRNSNDLFAFLLFPAFPEIVTQNKNNNAIDRQADRRKDRQTDGTVVRIVG